VRAETEYTPVAITDALLHKANTCAAAMTASVFSEEQAANGQAVVVQLRALFRPRPAVITHPALESAAPLLNHLPKEIVLAILHRLDTRSLARFAATCRALYHPVPPQQDSVVAVVLRDCVKGTRRRRLRHLQQLADQRRAQLWQRFADLAVHMAQRQLKNLR